MIDPEVKKQIVVDAVQNNWNDEFLLTILKATTEWKNLKIIMAFMTNFLSN